MVLDVAGSSPVTRPIILSIDFCLDSHYGIFFAGVAKLVDAPDLGSGIVRCGGSSPSARTIIDWNNNADHRNEK